MKHLYKYWLDYHKVLDRHSLSPEDKPYCHWWSLIAPLSKFLCFSKISLYHLSNTFITYHVNCLDITFEPLLSPLAEIFLGIRQTLSYKKLWLALIITPRSINTRAYRPRILHHPINKVLHTWSTQRYCMASMHQDIHHMDWYKICDPLTFPPNTGRNVSKLMVRLT